MKKLSLVFLLSLLFSISNYAQHESDYPTERNPGSCYAKCLMPDELGFVEKQLPVSTEKGDSSDSDELSVQVVPATTNWVKKKSNKNCQSADPEDCMIWCLIEVPAQFETYYVVKDTIANPNFELHTFKVQEIVKKGGFMAWQEVVCNNGITPRFLNDLAASLSQKGYPTSSVGKNGVMSKGLKSALVKYQKANYLPIGSLDFVTLRSLGMMKPGKQRRKKRKAKRRRRKNRKSSEH